MSSNHQHTSIQPLQEKGTHSDARSEMVRSRHVLGSYREKLVLGKFVAKGYRKTPRARVPTMFKKLIKKNNKK